MYGDAKKKNPLRLCVLAVKPSEHETIFILCSSYVDCL